MPPKRIQRLLGLYDGSKRPMIDVQGVNILHPGTKIASKSRSRPELLVERLSRPYSTSRSCINDPWVWSSGSIDRRPTARRRLFGSDISLRTIESIETLSWPCKPLQFSTAWSDQRTQGPIDYDVLPIRYIDKMCPSCEVRK